MPEDKVVETQEEKTGRYAETMLFYLDHPEAIHDRFLKAFMDGIRKKVEKYERQLEAAEAAAGGRPSRIGIFFTTLACARMPHAKRGYL